MRTETPETAGKLASMLRDARKRTLQIVADLDDAQMIGPRLDIVNPLLWEIAHIAWFQGFWVLRHLRGEPPVRPDEDDLYNSATVAHATRWDLALPTRRETLDYMREVLERVVDRLGAGVVDGRTAYFYRLVCFHEDMHGEAFLYTRQTHGYPAPTLSIADRPTAAAGGNGSIRGTDVEFPGGIVELGSSRDEIFAFDNEKWAHPVRVAPFRIARTPVTNAEYVAFVEDGGYARRELWSEEGWDWNRAVDASHPVYWRRDGTSWEMRRFDRWHPLAPELPVIHVNWHEASAYCRWANRRLPTEVEWVAAASGPLDPRTGSVEKRLYPWGGTPPGPEHANLDGLASGVVPVTAHGSGDSVLGCRQMIGNVWEWTASVFAPFSGFETDPYQEYSQPWFDGSHMVLKGGCWATRSRIPRTGFRNFYTRDRRDVFAGFRTCAR